MVNLNKIDRLALMALKSAIRLHRDAIYLYKGKRYPAAFLLSVLSQEEIGKAHIAASFVWTSRDYQSRKDGSGLTPKEEKDFLDLLYKHPTKQGSFLSNSHRGMSLLFTEKGRKTYKGVFEGELEAQKQKAAYVGLKRYKNKIDLKGKILTPALITQKHAFMQICGIHDSLVDTCVGIIADQYNFDISNIKQVFNRSLYKKLIALWSVSGKDTKNWIQNIERFLKKEKMKSL